MRKYAPLLLLVSIAGLVPFAALLIASPMQQHSLPVRIELQNETHNAYEAAQSRTVLLHGRFQDGSEYSGSGIPVRLLDGRVVVWTAGHCVDPLREGGNYRGLHVRTSVDAGVVSATVIRRARGRDLALLLLETRSNVQGNTFYGPSLRLGHRVLHCGAPLGYDWSVSEGIVSFVGRTGTNFPAPGIFDQTTATMAQGSSGGPVFDRETGQVVGLVSWGSPQTIGCYVPAREIRAFARESACEWAVSPIAAPEDLGSPLAVVNPDDEESNE